MLAWVAAIYLLLALRLRLRAETVFGKAGAFSLSVSAAGLELRLDGGIEREKAGFALRIAPRYGKQRRIHRIPKGHGRRLRSVWPYLHAALRSGRMERTALEVHIGLEDAAQTALAAGALRAAALSVLSIVNADETTVHIQPEFTGACFSAHACCIFSCQLGDIMTAVLKTALKKIGKEGFLWKSIPLRA